MATQEDLLADVLRLPFEERAEVAHTHLLGLEEGSEKPEAQSEWSAEFGRRAREVLDESPARIVTKRMGRKTAAHG